MQELGDRKRRVVTYERVSSEDQRDRETILTQTEELARRLEGDPDVIVLKRYVDNGVSGTVPMVQREGGGRLLRDAERGRIDELWVYKLNRLGRDAVDLLWVRRRLDQLGIRLISVVEGEQDLLGYDVHAVVSDYDRRSFLRHSQDGMNRAAREGRYCGGVVPYGYTVEGKKPNARLVPSTHVAVGNLTEADVLRRMYERVGVDGWSCRRVAEELNALGVAPVYVRDGREVKERGGVRKRRTKGVWTAGRVRNTVVQPIYRGELLYGRRSKKQREIISAQIEPLVSPGLWDAAKRALNKNRLMAKNTDRVYLLRSVLRCGSCARHFSGSWTKRDGVRYRCNGAVMFRQTQTGKCEARSFRGSDLEPVVRADIEGWLRNPGDVLEELASERDGHATEAVWEAERAMLLATLDQSKGEKDRLLDAYQAGAVPLADLKPRMDEVEEKLRALEERLRELEASVLESEPPVDEDLQAQIRRRLDSGLDDRQWQEIISLLVDVVLKTEVHDDGSKSLTAVLTYKFPAIVVAACTGRGSWRPPA